MTAASIFSGILFGTIGFVAFIYGKKQSLWKPMVIGVVLSVYTFFVTDTLAQYAVGALLTGLLFVFRD